MSRLLLWLPLLVRGNWLLQCTSCIDQAYYSDESQKTHVALANTTDCYDHVKRLGLHIYDHKHDEFFNKFFSRSQLGLDPSDVKMVLPGAISTLPERRWTAANGTTQHMKNVDLVRDSQVLLALLGATQEVQSRFEAHASHYSTWTAQHVRTMDDMKLVLDDMVKEQAYARKKREDMIEQVVRAVATGELAQKSLARAEGRGVELAQEVVRLRSSHEKHAAELDELTPKIKDTLDQHQVTIDNAAEAQRTALSDVEGRFDKSLAVVTASLEETHATDAAQKTESTQTWERMDSELLSLSNSADRLKESLEMANVELKKEASAETVERRREKEAEVEIALVAQQHDALRFQEEKTAIVVKHEEQRKSEELADARERKRIQMDLDGRAAHEKEMLNLKEASEQRLQEVEHDMKKERLAMQLQLDREKAELELKAEQERAKIEAEAKIRDKRDNADLYMAELQAQAIADREKLMAAIATVVDNVREAVTDLYGHPENLAWAIGSIVALALGIYFSREAATLAREQLNRRLGRPSLVRRTSRRSIIGDIFRAINRIFWRVVGCPVRAPSAVFDDVVLSQDMQKQIMRLANAARTAKQRKSPLLNVMFYGPPGTGKTMVAERFAEYSGLEYAIMAGGDVAPLEDQAVTELHKLFKWVKHSRKGVLLFIDEADAFLSSRNKVNMSEHLRNALTTMLYHTGTPSKQFMLVLATNRPHDLDTAIIDRIDEAVEFPLPDTSERTRLVKQYYMEFIGKDMPIPRSPVAGKEKADSAAGHARASLPTDDVFAQVAQQLRGFSGREITKLCMSLQTHIFAEARGNEGDKGGKLNLQPTTQMLFEVVAKKVKEHNRAIDILANGYLNNVTASPSAMSYAAMKRAP